MDEQALNTMSNTEPHIEIYSVDAAPGLSPYGDMIETTFIQGNMGGLVIIKLSPGEIPAHSHEQEHVGVVLQGSFEFFSGEDATRIQAGEIYRVGPNVPHGIRCRESALIVQSRA